MGIIDKLRRQSRRKRAESQEDSFFKRRHALLKLKEDANQARAEAHQERMKLQAQEDELSCQASTLKKDKAEIALFKKQQKEFQEEKTRLLNQLEHETIILQDRLDNALKIEKYYQKIKSDNDRQQKILDERSAQNARDAEEIALTLIGLKHEREALQRTQDALQTEINKAKTITKRTEEKEQEADKEKNAVAKQKAYYAKKIASIELREKEADKREAELKDLVQQIRKAQKKQKERRK